MRIALTIIGLFVSVSLFVGVSCSITAGERHMRKLANHQRLAIGAQLLDINTGLPVQCTTDTDCLEKTGINY